MSAGTEKPERHGRLLLAAFDYPPREYPGTRRARGLAKYLERLGYEVTVLTSAAGCPAPEPSGGEQLIRTRDLMASRLRRRQNGRTRRGPDRGDYTTARGLPSKLLVPDPMVVSWLPFAAARAIAEHRRRPFDCVLTTSPPESTNLIGFALARRGVPWVAELRDGWRFERPRRAWPTRAQARFDETLERWVLRRADRVTTVSRPATEDLRSRVGLEGVTIGHGYDFEEEPRMDLPSGVALDPDRHSLVHTGSMAAMGRSPLPLLDALRVLEREAPERLGLLELVFAGALSGQERELLEAPWLSGVVRLPGVLDHDSALRLQHEADTLLLITVIGNLGEVAGKLGEYMASGRPILVIGEQAEGGRIVDRARAGTVLPSDDPEALAAALSETIDSGRSPQRSGPEQDRVRNELDFARVAEQLATVIEDARTGTGVR